MEIWKPLPKWEGLYEVSSLGRVRSLDREWVQPHSRTGRPVKVTKQGKILKQSKTSSRIEYMRVTLRRPKYHEVRSVHQLVLEAFAGPKPEGMVCRHLNGDPTDNRAENLAWGSQQENVDDRASHGKTVRGTRHWQSRFSEDDVRSIRAEYEAGAGISELARKYGAPISTINNLLPGGKNWRHIA